MSNQEGISESKLSSNPDVDDISFQLSTHNPTRILNPDISTIIVTSENSVKIDLKAYENLNAKLDLLLAKRDFSENRSEKSRLDPPEDIIQVTISQNGTYRDDS